MNQRKIIFGITICAFVVACAFIAHATRILPPYAEAQTIAEGAQDFEVLSQRFAELAEKKGAAYAFDVLRITDLQPNTDTHLLGHVIGDILYKQKGVEGIALCTQEFRNACSHTIAIGALEEFGGEAALPRIREACHKAPGGPGAYTMCYHGLGHGVFAFYGYDLAKTVAFCKKTGTPEYHDREYIECVSGAIMELVGGGGHDKELWQKARDKYFDPHDLFSPCLSSVIPKVTKPLCIIYIVPQIYAAEGINLGSPDPTLFPAALRRCESLPITELRNACYQGFGSEFPIMTVDRDARRVDALTSEQAHLVFTWCALAGKGQTECFLSALRAVFWGGENDPAASLRLCAAADATPDLEHACYTHLAEQMHKYLKPDARVSWCTQLPPDAQAPCAQR